jgi:hypothetical protein
MPQNFEIKIEDIHDEKDLYARKASIKIGSRGYVPLYPAANPKSTKSSILKSPLFVENYITIPLEKLRLMDSNKAAQTAFIVEKFVSVPETPTFFIPKLLIKKDQRVTEKDIDYLVDLLNFHSNDIMVPPLIYYYHVVTPSKKFKQGINKPEVGIDNEAYLDFLKVFLSKAKQRGVESFAFVLPNNFAHDKLDILLAAYKDYDTKIAVIDAKGGKVSNLEPQLSKILSKSGKNYSLPEKHGEKFVLYSFDAIPYTAHKKEIAPAENILQYFSSFSSFGPRHTVNIVVNTPSTNPPRLYNDAELGYIRYNSALYKKEEKEFDKWIATEFPTATAKDKFSTYKRSYEISCLGNTVDSLYTNMKTTKFWDDILKIPNLANSLKQIQHLNKKLPKI